MITKSILSTEERRQKKNEELNLIERSRRRTKQLTIDLCEKVSKVLRRLFFHHTSFTRCHRFRRRRNLSPQVSPWHGIPLHLGDGAFNYVVEIPKESSAKMEVATDEQFTPIKQDTKKGKLRYYPYNINWNYGLLPQTWEDPSLANAEVEGAFRDNDPVDVVEIGERRGKIGEILKIKPLAALAMIDEGELDWKIVAISLDDPRASLVNDIDDVEKHFLVSHVLSPSSQTILHHNHLSIPLHVLLPANQISPIK